ncbi:MAG: patatin-like phospholipase family protein [Candidatus Micrarchaeaceae archaeon]
MGIKGIAFAGGGIKTIAYAGVIKKLNEFKLLNNLTHFAGTSAGAIYATALAFRINPSDILKFALSLDKDKLEDGEIFTYVYNFIHLYAINSGKKFHEWFLTSFSQFVPNFSEITFKEVLKIYNSFLIITATDFDNERVIYFNPEDTPDFKVFDALKATTALPLFYAPYTKDNMFLIDGGFIDNYPIEILYKYLSIDEVIGAKFLTKSTMTKKDRENLYEYIRSLISFLENLASDTYERDKIDLRRTIIINPDGISATDLSLTGEQKEKLILNGEESTEDLIYKLKLKI